MIHCGDLRISMTMDSPSHVRLLVERDQPPGHLPKRLVSVLIKKEIFDEEVGAVKPITEIKP